MFKIIFISLIGVAFVPANASGQYSGGEGLQWSGMERALQLASDSDKTILAYVYDESCPYCQRMESDVYPDRRIVDLINEYFVAVRININSTEPLKYLGQTFTQAQFAQALDVQGVPVAYFLNEKGEIVGRQPGFLSVDMFATLLEFVGSGAYRSQTFDEYRGEHYEFER